MFSEKLAHPANAPNIVKQKQIKVPRAVHAVECKKRYDDPAPHIMKLSQRGFANVRLAIASVFVFASFLQGIPVYPYENKPSHSNHNYYN